MCQNPLNCSCGCGFSCLALIVHWSCLDLASLPCLDLAFSLPKLLLDLAFTLPWTCPDLVLTLIFVQNKLLVQKDIWIKKNKRPQKIGSKKIGQLRKILVPKFRTKKIRSQNYEIQKIISEKKLSKKSFRPKQILVKIIRSKNFWHKY